jgi:hypothetical protein
MNKHVALVHEAKSNSNVTYVKGTMKTQIAAVHEEKKSFKCDICDCNFFRKDEMKFHVASVHEGRKPFKYDICDKSFTQKSRMKSHIASVHEEKKLSIRASSEYSDF